ncbi:MAG: 2-oxo acid dehydrogenase subunit E2 [Bacteroidia bacterium]|nr:2-oxo acid dehydrogenase subunit E2 [Bacteroidia bacterium]
MKEVELILPKMGESIAEATITKWLKNEGDKIANDEAVVEIATDKVDSEVPSTFEGVLVKKLFSEGQVAPVGAPIAIIGIESNAGDSTSQPTTESPTQNRNMAASVEQAIDVINKDIQSAQISTQPLSNADASRFYSPLVLNIAKTEGISMEALENIAGTGANGRVTKRDILAFIENGQQQPSISGVQPTPVINTTNKAGEQAATLVRNIQAPKITLMEGDEIIEMDRMRKLISEHMVMSKTVSPHVTSFVEADVTNLVLWRNKVKNSFEKREGEKITFTPIFIEAIAKAIKDMPMINVSLDGDKIIKRKAINIGMATALPSGNLIVPVIRNSDTLNLVGLSKVVNDLAKRARENKLKPDETSGGTFTITNVGTFGNVMGTPIINQPQVAILATGAIRKKPAVIETPQGDMIGIRHMMYLSLSYDHRIVDGALGGAFVRKVADYLEDFDYKRYI